MIDIHQQTVEPGDYIVATSEDTQLLRTGIVVRVTARSAEFIVIRKDYLSDDGSIPLNVSTKKAYIFKKIEFVPELYKQVADKLVERYVEAGGRIG